MKRRKRIIYTAEQRVLMWDRYQQGDFLADIARLFDRYHPSIERIIAGTGGIRPPRPRGRGILNPSLIIISQC
jgi:IS30 family transposase